MTPEERKQALDENFRKRVRFVAENSEGKLSAAWMFWPKKNDFYFGTKSLLSSLKVSLHANGVGYIGYDKSYFLRKKAGGVNLPAKTVHEWKLPIAGEAGAVHAASVVLPADYFTGAPLHGDDIKKTIVLGVSQGSAAVIDIFLHKQSWASLEPAFLKIGHPTFAATLDGGSHVSIVVRSRPFDVKELPPGFPNGGVMRPLRPIEPKEMQDLKAMLFSSPPDGGTLQMIEISGLSITPAT